MAGEKGVLAAGGPEQSPTDAAEGEGAGGGRVRGGGVVERDDAIGVAARHVEETGGRHGRFRDPGEVGASKTFTTAEREARAYSSLWGPTKVTLLADLGIPL